MVDLSEQNYVSLSTHSEFQNEEISFLFNQVTKTRDLNKDKYSQECSSDHRRSVKHFRYLIHKCV